MPGAPRHRWRMASPERIPSTTLETALPVPARAIAILSLAAFASAATTRICDGLLPQISSDFSVSTGAAAQVITAYSASYGLLQIVHGLLGDRLGKERMLIIGAVSSLVTTLACAAATSLTGLVWARLLAGVTAAGIIPLSLAWIGDAIPYAARQAVIARFISGQIGGVIVGLAFGGAIGDWLGWRAAFWLIAALYVFATAGLLLQFGGAMRAKPPERPATGSLTTVVAILRRPWVRIVLLMTFFEGFLCFGALAYVTSVLHARFGLNFTAAGFTLGCFGLGGLLFTFAGPHIVRRFGEAGGARLSSIFFLAAFIGFAVMPNAWFGAVASLAAGLAYYLLHNVLQVNATQMATDARGAAVSLFATAFFTGQGLGVAVAAPIIDRYGATPIFLVTAVCLPILALGFAQKIDRRNVALEKSS